MPSSSIRNTATAAAGEENPLLRDPDVQLMLSAKRGDDSSFNQLVTRYQERLVSVLYHLIGDQETAEDLAQESFLRVYRARHGYEPTAKFSTWLFRIANNLALNSKRDTFRKREVSLPASDTGPLGTRPAEKQFAEKSALMPTRQADKNEMLGIVRSALTELNERQRAALLLHKFEGMSYADIGNTLELTEPAVKSLLSRARTRLREVLEPYVKASDKRQVSKPSPDDD